MEFCEMRGERVPKVGFGTWQLRGSECTEGVRHAIELGYRMIDTSPNYENEEQVGSGMRESGVDRDEIFLVTKVERYDLEPEAVARSVDESLRRLGTDRLDLWLIHQPNPDVPVERTLEAMRREQEAGKVRHLGVSNFSPDLLRRSVEAAEILCDQEEYHPGQDRSDHLEVCRKHDVVLMAYSPLGRGDLADDGPLAEIGRRHRKTPAQVAVRWLVQQEPVVTIPRSSDPDHRRQNLEVFDFELSDEEMERLGA